MTSHGIPRVSNVDKTEASRRKELQSINAYKELVDLVNTKVAAKEYTPETLALTAKLLAENPEYYTIWNHRRLILQYLFAQSSPQPDPSDTHDVSQDAPQAPTNDAPTTSPASTLIPADLQFLIPLLLKFPKCYWIWNHRLFLLSSSLTHLSASLSLQIWTSELSLINKMLLRDARNFHAWDYRRFVVTSLEQQTGTSMTVAEFEYTTKMVKSNLSNFSAWHRRGKLLPRLLNEMDASGTERRKRLNEEFELVDMALNTDPYDQSLWFYHQFLVENMMLEDAGEEAIVRDVGNAERAERLRSEIEGIREIEEDTKDCKWLYQGLLRYAGKMVEVDAGTRVVTTEEMRGWLESLRGLDPLRKGRWDDLERSLSLRDGN